MIKICYLIMQMKYMLIEKAEDATKTEIEKQKKEA